MNPRWDLVTTNRAAVRFFGMFVDLDRVPAPANVLRLMFDPNGLKPFVVNWEEVAAGLLLRARREAVGGVPSPETELLLAEVSAGLGLMPLGGEPAPFVPVRFRKGDLTLGFFSTVTTLGAPQDVTLQELRIECFFPADPETEAAARRLA